MKRVYLDHAATTRPIKEALEAYSVYAEKNYYNPSSLYNCAFDAKKELEQARKQIAALLHVSAEEIVFTGSGTESNNLALFGALKRKSGNIVIGGLEHASIYEPATFLASKGYEVRLAPVDRFGKVDTNAFAELVDQNTLFVSVMHVCNETGASNDVRTLCALVKEKNPKVIFHSDGVQAFLKSDVDLKHLGVDLYSISAHKIYAPKGVGALYIQKGLHIKPLFFGGGQEHSVRPSTENTAGIHAFSAAAQRVAGIMHAESDRQSDLLKAFHPLLAETLPEAVFYTDCQHAAPHIFSFSLPDVRAEVLVHVLETYGFLVGTGSSCASSKSKERVYRALQVAPRHQEGMLRVSIGMDTTQQDLENFTQALAREYRILSQIRRK